MCELILNPAMDCEVKNKILNQIINNNNNNNKLVIMYK